MKKITRSAPFNDAPKSFTLGAVCTAFGLPQPPREYDPRIAKLAQQTIYPYEDVAQALVFCASILGVTVEYCINFCDGRISQLDILVFCAIATKHWNAPNRAPLQALCDDTRG